MGAAKQNMSGHWRQFKIRLLIGLILLFILQALAVTSIVLQNVVGRYFQSNRNRLVSLLITTSPQYLVIIFLFVSGKVCLGAYGNGVTPTKPTTAAIITLGFAIATMIAEAIFFWAFSAVGLHSGLTGVRNEELSHEQFAAFENAFIGTTIAAGVFIFPYLGFLCNMAYWGFWIRKVVMGYQAIDAQPLHETQAWRDDVEIGPQGDFTTYDSVKAQSNTPTPK